MTEVVRKALLFGIGSVYMTKEKIQEFVDDLVNKQKLSPEEGKKLVQEALDKVSDFKNKHNNDLRDMVASVINELGLATKKDLDKLKKDLKGTKKK